MSLKYITFEMNIRFYAEHLCDQVLYPHSTDFRTVLRWGHLDKDDRFKHLLKLLQQCPYVKFHSLFDFTF
jgi:hypothetical protein